MKCPKILIAALAVVLLPCHAADSSDEYQWEHRYDGVEIPVTGNYSWHVFQGSATLIPSHDGGALVINTNGELDEQAYYTSTEWEPSPDASTASAEVRCRVESVAEKSINNAVIVFAIGIESGGTALYLGPEGLYLFPGSGPPVVTDLDPFESHTYRIILNVAENLFSLEIDGVEKLSDQPLNLSFDSNVLRIGDMSSSVGGIVHYEHVAWSNSGSPTPASTNQPLPKSSLRLVSSPSPQ